MKADYDSEADALSIDLVRFDRYDHQEQVDDDYCNVGIVNGRAVDVELLYPAEHLDLLKDAAERYDLDGTAREINDSEGGLPDRAGSARDDESGSRDG